MIRACLASSAGVVMCAIIKKPTVSMPRSRARPKCWMDTSASVQWVAIRPPSRRLAGVAQVAGADARHEQHGDLGLGGLLHRGRDQRDLVHPREPVVEGGPAQAVAVSDLDDLHAGRVQRVHGRADLLLGELVRHRVAAVAQRGVGDAQVVRWGVAEAAGVITPPPLGPDLGDELADAGGRRGHDVQVAGVLGQVVAGPRTSRKTATRALPFQAPGLVVLRLGAQR